MQRVSGSIALCYHPDVGRLAVVLLVFVLSPVAPAHAQDALAEARRHYNAGEYEAAVRLARSAIQHAASANAARVVLGRTQLERFRKSASPADLADARTSLRDVDPRALDARERLELTLGFAEIFFLEDRFAAAAEMFEPAIEASASLGAPAHERVLDWWATALDRYAQSRPAAERGAIYTRILRRMSGELMRDGGSSAAGYWAVAAARGNGDLDGAWSAAMAAWVRGGLARDRGVALRGDLDRLVVQALIPERAARMAAKDPSTVVTGLLAEWESFKASWSK